MQQRGAIRKRSGRYQVDVYVDKERVRRTVQTRREAQDLLAKLNEADPTSTS